MAGYWGWMWVGVRCSVGLYCFHSAGWRTMTFYGRFRSYSWWKWPFYDHRIPALSAVWFWSLYDRSSHTPCTFRQVWAIKVEVMNGVWATGSYSYNCDPLSCTGVLSFYVSYLKRKWDPVERIIHKLLRQINLWPKDGFNNKTSCSAKIRLKERGLSN